MKKTLKFRTLSELARFVKRINNGYMINTIELTVSAPLSFLETAVAVDQHNAVLLTHTTPKLEAS